MRCMCVWNLISVFSLESACVVCYWLFFNRSSLNQIRPERIRLIISARTSITCIISFIHRAWPTLPSDWPVAPLPPSSQRVTVCHSEAALGFHYAAHWSAGPRRSGALMGDDWLCVGLSVLLHLLCHHHPLLLHHRHRERERVMEEENKE